MKQYFLVGLLALSTPTYAQERMSSEECVLSAQAVETLLGRPEGGDRGAAEADEEGWCVVHDLTLITDPRQSYRLDTLRWRAGGIERLIEDGLPPRSIEVIGKGGAVVAQTGDPVMDYLIGLLASTAESGFGFSVRWDGVQNSLMIEDLYVDISAGNRIEASARIDNVDLTDAQTIQTSFGSMGLSDLLITSDFSGWFEAYVALPLGMEVLESDGPPPEAQVALLKTQAADFLSEFPDTVLPDASEQALVEFINELPEPRGALRFQLDADPPIGAARMAPFALLGGEPTPEQIIDLGLEGVDLFVTWTPTGD
ncbi:hypothetical protein Q4555_03785 [Octadecabacter sp. 1_MG-2023]|uniref:hypothetical protein n=1 Tax=unclassified Octadecabacter TaxID=196158 RepID=UPI001C0870B9|nr:MULTISPECIES: hypothetical protein [unclassified Octadecabacter]MBU2992775.1 hypothetical protein [Octadecabacter sp. B2R22]MDO6733774.1 hypothetical protein [Octadecabacter sp. 1_MG-2023]